MDDECRRAVGRRLDGQHEDDERRDPPLPQHGANSATDPTMIGSTNPPATVEPTNEASVRAGVRCAASHTLKRSLSRANAPGMLHHPRDEKPEADREAAIAAKPASITITKTTAG